MSRLAVRSSLAAACFAACLAAAAAPAGAASSPTCVSAAGTTTCTYAFTGGAQGFAVPAGSSTVVFDIRGAQGGAGGGAASCGFGSFVSQPGGKGAEAAGVLPATAGSLLQINLGGTGGTTTGLGGFNGGGPGAGQSADRVLAGGGGASDIRTSPYGPDLRYPTRPDDRKIVAGGGGGGGACQAGGAGGGVTGLPGAGGAAPGGGATALLGGTSLLTNGVGIRSVGGSGRDFVPANAGAGGGGGLFGGGAGSASSPGGGGSGLDPFGAFTVNAQTGDGAATITFPTLPATFASLCTLTRTMFGTAGASFAFPLCQDLTSAATGGLFRGFYVSKYKSELARSVSLNQVSQSQANFLLAFLATIP